MAVRRLEAGGQPVYVIEVDVPKVTDSRGKGYGTLVSDQRWKLWEEVQASQLQQMKYEQMSKQAQLDVLEQKQRDISRAIRDARELQSKVKSGAITPYQAQQMEFQRAKANRGTLTVRTEPARDPFTGEILEGQTVETRTTRTPIGPEIPPFDFTSATPEEIKEYNEQQAAEAQNQIDRLETYISGLETERTAAEAEFQDFIKTGLAPQDLLSRTRDAFGSQIGEGGFGISRRPLRQLSRFDELEAVGLLDDTIARAEAEIMAESKKFFPEGVSPQAEQDLKRRAREEVARQLSLAGAEPTSRAGFLMKDFPQGPALLPREETRVPTGRFRDDFAVESTAPALDRVTEIKRDLDRLPGGLANPAAEGLLMELQDVRRREMVRPTPSPAETSMMREVELEALGASPEEIQAARRRREEDIRIGEEERLAAGRLPRDRGFTYPVETIAGVPTTTGGRPGGLMDRMTVNRLGRTQDVSGSPPATSPMVTPTPAAPVPQVQPVLPRGGSPEVAQEPVASPAAGTFEDLSGGLYIVHDGKGGGTVYDGKTPILSTYPGAPGSIPKEVVAPDAFKERVRELKKKGVEEAPEAKGRKGAQTVPQRQEVYAMKTIKRGLELADKPKQFARLAKTETPAAAPEYIKLVNGVYEMNSTSPNRFKLTYDEVARVFRDDPQNREKALSYLVAKDAIETNVTKPV